MPRAGRATEKAANLSADGLSEKWLPGVMAQSALLWTEIPIRITGTWWCDTRIEVLTLPASS